MSIEREESYISLDDLLCNAPAAPSIHTNIDSLFLSISFQEREKRREMLLPMQHEKGRSVYLAGNGLIRAHLKAKVIKIVEREREEEDALISAHV